MPRERRRGRGEVVIVVFKYESIFISFTFCFCSSSSLFFLLIYLFFFFFFFSFFRPSCFTELGSYDKYYSNFIFEQAYGQTFIEDDHFLALVGSISSMFNCIGRPLWGIFMDRFRYKVGYMFHNGN